MKPSPGDDIMIHSDSKVHGANMGPIWGRQGPGGPHVAPMNFAIWDIHDRMSYTVWTSFL